MIVSTVSSGICDRIAMALYAYHIARAAGKEFIFIWQENNYCNCPFERLFQPTDKMTVLPRGPFGEVTPGSLHNRIEAAKSTEGVVYIGGVAYYGHDFTDMDRLFIPSIEVTSIVDAFRSENWQPLMIGVHIRRTDKSYQQPPSVEQYVRVVNSLANHRPECGVFLATDDEEVLTEFQRLWKGPLCHFPARTLLRSEPDGIVDALATLYLLRSTNVVVGSLASGYSICAGWNTGFIDVPFGSSENYAWDAQPLRMKPPNEKLFPHSYRIANSITIPHSPTPRREAVLGVFDAAYVISCPATRHREMKVSKELGRIGLKAARFPAVPPSHEEGSSCSPSERSLTLSNIEIVRRAKAEGCRSVLILEDDVVFKEQFCVTWESIQPKIAQLNYDLLYFYDWADGDTHYEPCIKSINGTLCTHAFAVSVSFFDKYIEQLTAHYRTSALDRILDSIDARKYAIVPNLAGQEGGPSSISGYWPKLRWSMNDG